jgi:hypothetical protein
VQGKEQGAEESLSARATKHCAAYREKMVEAVGIEPTSRTTQPKRLRVYPSEFMPGLPQGLDRQQARLGL